MNMDTLLAKAVDVGADIGMKILGAILLWIVGKWLIGLCLKIIGRVLEKRKVDGTVVAYLNSFMGVALTVVLVIVTLGIFGVQTTTFAAVWPGRVCWQTLPPACSCWYCVRSRLAISSAPVA